MRRWSCVVAGLLAIPIAATPVRAQEPASEGATRLAVRTSIKAGALLFKAPDAPDLFPQPRGTESVWRIRVEPQVTSASNAVFTLAYEQRLRTASATATTGTAGILPPQTPVAYRIRALDWPLSETGGSSWRHEIDRASVQLRLKRTEITAGRQAIGWGRGVMFGAVDLFAPFSPLEADREWRRGVDAIRADTRLTDRTSIELVGAFGVTWDRSVVAARVRGYAQSADVEVMIGRRAQDLFAGATASAPVGDAEVHGELALFLADVEPLDRRRHPIWKAVLGGSYRFPVGSGLLTFAEYHYSGFAAPRPEDIVALLTAPAFIERYARGDTQTLSRHAVAVSSAYESSPELSYSAQWIHSPRDGSGLVAPAVTYTFGDSASVIGSGYLPYGRSPIGAQLSSEFGAARLAALLQLRLYF